MQTVVLTGGGSGGHITPILAVATELKKQRPDIRIVYVGQKGDSLVSLTDGHSAIDEVKLISAGKFRRYHGEGLRQLLHAPTVAKNFRDFFKVAGGAGQAYRLLGKLKADAVYTPGGYVGVPVGMAAARRGIPLLTHDLDAIPGLANRVNARWATLHLTALPPQYYRYPVEQVVYAGVPVAAEFKPVSQKLQQSYRLQLGLPSGARVLFVIGGGLGAQRVNDAVVSNAKALLERFPDLYILHATGGKNEDLVNKQYRSMLTELQQKRVKALGFIKDVYIYSGAADLIITRAGATNMAEFENQHKACIVIPSPVLSGGHQIKNVEERAKAGAIELLTEDEMANNGRLAEVAGSLLSSDAKLSKLSESIATFAKPYAAKTAAQTILSVMKNKSQGHHETTE